MTFPSFFTALKITFHGKIGLAVASSLWVGLTTIAVSEAFKGQILSAIISAIPSTGMVVIAWRGIHKQLNSRIDELVKAQHSIAFSEGEAKERNRQDKKRGN